MGYSFKQAALLRTKYCTHCHAWQHFLPANPALETHPEAWAAPCTHGVGIQMRVSTRPRSVACSCEPNVYSSAAAPRAGPSPMPTYAVRAW